MAFSSFFSDRLVEEAVSNPLFTNLGMARSDSASLTKSSSNLHKHSIAAAAYVYIALVCCPREQPQSAVFCTSSTGLWSLLSLEGIEMRTELEGTQFFCTFFLVVSYYYTRSFLCICMYLCKKYILYMYMILGMHG